MLMLRRSGGTTARGDDRTLPSTRISPPSGSSKPAIMRKVVVLPQPDGPSRHTSAPCLTVKSIASTETTAAYRLVSLSTSRRAIASVFVAMRRTRDDRRTRSPRSLHQQSTTLTASPPSDVSLYFDIISRPVSYMVL